MLTSLHGLKPRARDTRARARTHAQTHKHTHTRTCARGRVHARARTHTFPSPFLASSPGWARDRARARAQGVVQHAVFGSGMRTHQRARTCMCVACVLVRMNVSEPKRARTSHIQHPRRVSELVLDQGTATFDFSNLVAFPEAEPSMHHSVQLLNSGVLL